MIRNLPFIMSLQQFERFPIKLDHWHGGDFGTVTRREEGALLRHRYRQATLHHVESDPPQSGRPKGDDGGATWSENR